LPVSKGNETLLEITMTTQQRPPVQHQQQHPIAPANGQQEHPQEAQQQQANDRGPQTPSKKNPGKRPHQGGGSR
jgi:hypothetical protein